MNSDPDEFGRQSIPLGPPWPGDFVADLHAVCYDCDEIVDPSSDPMIAVWAAVRANSEASRMLDDLDDIRAVLGRLSDYQREQRPACRLQRSGQVQHSGLPITG